MTNLPAPQSNSLGQPDIHTQLVQLNDKLKDLKQQATPPPAPKLKASRPRVEPPAPPRGQPTESEGQLEAFANDKAKEALILRTALKYGLSEDDFDGDYQTPAEVEMAAKVKQLEQQITTLNESAQAQKQELDSLKSTQPPEPNADTGGPTSREATRAKKGQQLREEAAKQPRKPLSVYKALQAAHADPDKVMLVRPGELEEE